MTEPLCVPQKVCKKCTKSFPTTLEYFGKNKADKPSKDGLRATCKVCVSSAMGRFAKVPDGFKRCSKCRRELPKTAENFGKCETNPGGMDYLCKQCNHDAAVARYKKAKERGPKETPPPFMQCTHCKKDKPTTHEHFAANPLGKYGFMSYCKACAVTVNKGTQERHRERINLRNKRRYPIRRSYFKRRYQLHRESILSRQYAFKSAHPEIVRQWQRTHKQSEKGALHHRIRQERRRSLKMSIPGVHTAQQIREQLIRQKCKCYYCGNKFKIVKGKHVYHIDHTFPLSRVVGTDIPANDMGYLVLACPFCNTSKGNKYPWEWHEGGRLL